MTTTHPEPMTRQTEQRVLDAVKEVVASVENGDTPTDAVIKAAQSYDLGRQMIPLVVNAYNVGRTTWQQSHGNNILNKQAEFPIARLEDVLSAVFPSSPPTPAAAKQAGAVSDEYGRPPALEPSDDRALRKAAENYQLPPLTRMSLTEWNSPEERPTARVDAVHRLFEAEKRAVEACNFAYLRSRDRYLAAMGAVRDYFKEAAMFRKPFAEVERNAVFLFGEPAKHAMDYAYTTGRMKEARAAGSSAYLSRAVATDKPYALIKAAIDCGKAMIDAHKHLAAEKKASSDRCEAALRPFTSPLAEELPGTPQRGETSGFSAGEAKAAGLFGNLAMMGAGSYARGRGTSDALKNDPVQKAEESLNSPDHLLQLREIETRAMLQDLLSNDEVIAGYDPEEVIDAYNEIAQLSPNAAEQPAIIRPMLRKRLAQGAIEPFEAQEMANIEKTLRQTSGFPDPRLPAPASSGGGSGGGKQQSSNPDGSSGIFGSSLLAGSPS